MIFINLVDIIFLFVLNTILAIFQTLIDWLIDLYFLHRIGNISAIKRLYFLSLVLKTYWETINHTFTSISWVSVMYNMLRLQPMKIILTVINFQHVYHIILFCLSTQMSILVHPDKNQDDLERAQKSFEGKMFYLLVKDI